jgi:high-affinity Fe2+/Pb2+ permease
LGLWNYAWVSILLEVLLFVGGIWLYLKSTKALNDKGRIGFWAGVAVLAVLYLGAAYLAAHYPLIQTILKRPLTPNMVTLASLIQFVFVGWGYWLDRQRKPV